MLLAMSHMHAVVTHYTLLYLLCRVRRGWVVWCRGVLRAKVGIVQLRVDKWLRGVIIHRQRQWACWSSRQQKGGRAVLNMVTLTTDIANVLLHRLMGVV